jgi:tetratricopeptide (TPR) repeat protein
MPPARQPSLSASSLRVFLASRSAVWLAAGILLLAGYFAYCASFSGPFILDDLPAIAENPTITRLWPLPGPLAPPLNGQTVTGRPFVNLTLAVNYAFGGLSVRGYHAVNLAIHLLATLALFGVARRTFLSPPLRERYGPLALPLGFLVALLWVVHPLATESVSYLIQRAEALMALFYLLTLYAFIRAAASSRPRRWLVLSFFACLVGMACKEVMVSAPLIVLLYDRTFVAGGFSAAWRLRWRYYLALASTWLLLGWLVLQVGTRGDSAGFGAGVDWLAYALTQFGAITHYLVLAAWPRPLVLDYGFELAATPAQIVPYAVFIGVLVAGTVYALWRRPVLGFFGFAFFAILAPSSSIVPVVTQTVAEHRMYLPLAVLIGLAVAGGYRLLGQYVFLLGLGLAVVYGTLTFQRNVDYRTGVSIWSDTAAKRPNNARAHENLAINLVAAGRPVEGVGEYYTALRLLPDYAEAHTNLGNALGGLGRTDEAVEHFRAAIRLIPSLTAAHYNLANILTGAGRLPEAVDEFTIAIRLNPNFAPSHNNLGNVLSSLGRTAAAKAEYEAAIQCDPAYAVAHNNLANLCLKAGLNAEAEAQYHLALQLDPGYADAHFGLANTYFIAGRVAAAIAEYQAALQARPDFPDARSNLALAQKQLAASPPAPAAP